MRFWLLAATLTASAPAFAEDVGIPVTVEVLDGQGLPIPTAVVRHPLEADPHRVNTETGKWTASVLYMPDGSELIFEKGLALELEVSAPGYISRRVTYEVRKRKNLAEVSLDKLDTSFEDDFDADDISIGFGRDVPRQ